MAVKTTVVGSYPKPPDEGLPFPLRKTLQRVERGEATSDDVRAAEDALVREVIGEQEDAGVDLITDGHGRWDDIVTPFARHMGGFSIGGLRRFFDNNVYYRRPICNGEIEWRGPASVEAWRFAHSVATKPVKAIVPGPITFAHLCVDEHYRDHARLVLAIARVLAHEVLELEAAGARFIQIDEPALVDAPEDLGLAGRALETMTAELQGSETETILTTYFGDAKRLGKDLFALPVTCFGLDLVSGPEARELVVHLPRAAKLQAGIVDARNTRLEPVASVRLEIEGLVDALGEERVWVSPSCGLEFLPRKRARAKLLLLSDAARR
jgi:5-methyltetrahydropteroyltriglutamate--homocysteine methyltransferase